jgi:hypothetical protein
MTKHWNIIQIRDVRATAECELRLKRCDVSQILSQPSGIKTTNTDYRKKKGKAVPLHAMEALGGERKYSSYPFSTSALDGGERSASRPGRAFTPRERTPDTHWTGGWVGPRAALDTDDREKNPLPLPGILNYCSSTIPTQLSPAWCLLRCFVFRQSKRDLESQFSNTYILSE